jgi:hypothetical protein
MHYREPIYHDRQSVRNDGDFLTSSTEFVDLTGVTLTTKDLGSTGSYAIHASVLVSGSLNNTTVSFRVTSDGTPLGDGVDLAMRTKDLDEGYTFLGTSSEVEAGKDLQIQVKTDIGTVTVRKFSLLIDGIPAIRVIQ